MRVGMIDLDTGELLQEGVPVWVGAKARSPYGNRWMTVNQDFLAELAARRDIGMQDMRVFLYLNSRLDFHNVIRVPQVEIAAALNMKRPNVSKSVKKLEALGIILKGPIPSSWRLNPNAGWKGKVKDLQSALEQPHLRVVEKE